MIGFFKNNLFVNSLLLLPYLAIIRINSILNPIAYTVLDSDTFITKSIFSILGGPLTQNIIAIVVLYFHMLYINRLVIQHRLANQVTLLPGLIYAIFMSLLPEYSFLTPYLIANTFILIAISQIFKTYKRPKAADVLFNIGFLIAIAALFEPNYIFLLIIGILGLFVLRSLKLFEVFQLLSGALLVLISFCSIFYLLDISILPELTKVSLHPRLEIFSNRGGALYKILIVFVISVFTVLNYGSYTLKKNIQTQKKIDILYWFMLSSLIILFINDTMDSSQLLLLFIPLSILLNSTFINIKSILFQEVIHISLLALLFALNFNFI